MRTTTLVALVAAFASSPAGANESLPSWNDGPVKRAVIAFVEKVTKVGGPGFVPAPERIAVFDNDGTLWSEQPTYVQVAFTLDRIKAQAEAHPEWRGNPLFKAAMDGDLKVVLAGPSRDRLELLAGAYAGMTSDEFERSVSDWLAKARHPRFGRPYTELVYQPMLELLGYLRANGFKAYIVSGGGVDFLRPWAEHVYGIPPEQVIGSAIRERYEVRDGRPVLVRLPEVAFVDDRAGKPVGIQRAIGRRPIAAFGNSDGDYEMLRWTTAGAGPRLGLIVHHTDEAREWAYDRESPVGRLVRALDDAPNYGWIVADMKSDWRVIYPFQRGESRRFGSPVSRFEIREDNWLIRWSRAHGMIEKIPTSFSGKTTAATAKGVGGLGARAGALGLAPNGPPCTHTRLQVRDPAPRSLNPVEPIIMRKKQDSPRS
jgi:phosphoglycolate phosphatase-like HAD superfamily hydrolase